MTLSIIAFSIIVKNATLSIMTLSIKGDIVMLSVVYADFTNAECYAEYFYAECWLGAEAP
jgi:hypothetical protein